MSLRPPRIAIAAAPLVALLSALLTPGAGRALPAYSRASGLACRQCHGSFSGLNRDGLRFLQAGDRAGSALAAAHAAPARVAFSLVADLDQDFASADSVAGARGVRDRDRRTGEVSVHALGSLSEHATYHIESQLPTRAGAFVTDAAFVQIDDLAPHGTLNLKAGEYLVQGPYLALSRPARYTNVLTAESLPARGLELNGAGGAWTYGAGLITSRRTAPAHASVLQAFGRLEDPYAWLARDLGGQRIGARVLFDRQDSNLPYLAWLQHIQAQANAVLAFHRLALVPAWTFDRFDDRPAGGLHQRRQTALVEARMPLDVAQRWQLTAFAEHDYTTRTRYSREADHHQESLELGYAVRQNAELAVEVTHAGDNVAGPRVDQLNTFLRFGY